MKPSLTVKAKTPKREQQIGTAGRSRGAPAPVHPRRTLVFSKFVQMTPSENVRVNYRVPTKTRIGSMPKSGKRHGRS